MQLKTKKFPRQRHFLAVFFISFLWGVFGADRMYLGKWWTGLAKLVTLGGLGIWALVDLILIMNGAMRDAQGREMLQFAEYKTFAYKTILYFAIALGVIILVTGISLILTIEQLIENYQNGTLPGLDGITKQLQGSGMSPEQLKSLGL
jgi:TM2 domain-containing membrane protein YozV